MHKPDSLTNIPVPIILFAGDQDDVTGFENGVAKLFRQLESKYKYMMVSEKAR